MCNPGFTDNLVQRIHLMRKPRICGMSRVVTRSSVKPYTKAYLEYRDTESISFDDLSITSMPKN